MTDQTQPAVSARAPDPAARQATITVPLRMLYGGDLPQTVRFTWLQLYGLARRLPGGQLQTPPLPLKELGRITGKSVSGLYNQLAVLRSLGLLLQHSLNDGRIILQFAEQDASAVTAEAPGLVDGSPAVDDVEMASEVGNAGEVGMVDPPVFAEEVSNSQESRILESRFQDSVFQDSRFQETGITPSLKYLKDSKNQIFKIKEREGEFQDSRIQESGNADDSNNPRSSPIAIYHELTGLHLNKVQRKMLLDQVNDLPLWRETLTHWLGHHWNPFNIPGMLDLFQRGGPPQCSLCSRVGDPGAQPDLEQEEDEPNDPIAKLRRRHGIA